MNIKKIYSNEPPEFVSRLKPDEISDYPCFNCLRETEVALEKGYWKNIPIPVRYWYEMCDAEATEIRNFLKKHRPKKILEIGGGGGRIIKIISDVNYPKEIFAIDKDARMVKLSKPLFKNKPNVHIVCDTADKFLQKHNSNFDLTLCMMNTLGNVDNLSFLRQIASHSKDFIFTLYDKNYSSVRSEIYKSRGHKKFSVANGCYYFHDEWVKGLVSKSFSRKEIEEMCKQTGKKFTIKKISTLLYLVHIKNKTSA